MHHINKRRFVFPKALSKFKICEIKNPVRRPPPLLIKKLVRRGGVFQVNTSDVLCVKDLEKLNEEELKFLPLKDFWDATKKEWKKNVFDTFAKRNSVKMKEILLRRLSFSLP